MWPQIQLRHTSISRHSARFMSLWHVVEEHPCTPLADMRRYALAGDAYKSHTCWYPLSGNSRRWQLRSKPRSHLALFFCEFSQVPVCFVAVTGGGNERRTSSAGRPSSSMSKAGKRGAAGAIQDGGSAATGHSFMNEAEANEVAVWVLWGLGNPKA